MPAELDQYSVFAVYDLAVSRWVASVLSCLPEKDEMTMVMAGPQRAFAEAREILNKQRRLRGQPPLDGELRANIPLPLVSIARGTLTQRMDQRVAPGFGFRERRFTDSSGFYNRGGKPPLPVMIDYQIDVWTEKVDTFSRMMTTFQKAFDPQMAWGKCKPHPEIAEGLMPIRLEGITNNSNLEGGDKDREMRFTVSIQIEGWVYHDMETRRVAKDVVIETGPHADFGEFHLPASRFPALYVQSDVNGTWWKVFSYRGNAIFHPVEATEVPKPATLFPESTYLILPDTLVLGQTSFGVKYDPDTEGLKALGTIRPDAYAEPLVVNKGQRLWVPKSSKGYGELHFDAGGHPRWVPRYL